MSTDGGKGGSALEAEFDTVAAWTEQAVAELGADHAVPAACRGSGSPADLEWLAAGLELAGDAVFLDAGSGLGGPAAWLVEHLRGTWSGRGVLAEPMTHAAAASRRLFGLDAVAAWTEQLPVRDAAVDAAWSLGVLCTTPDRAALLGELRRVLRPGGRMSLLVLVATVDALPEQPEGNDFPTADALRAALDAAGFRIDDEVDAATLPGAPDDWSARADAVEEIVTRDHGGEPAWRQADENQQVMGRLMGARQVVTTLLRTTAV